MSRKSKTNEDDVYVEDICFTCYLPVEQCTGGTGKTCPLSIETNGKSRNQFTSVFFQNSAGINEDDRQNKGY